jgi:cell division protein FtsB
VRPLLLAILLVAGAVAWAWLDPEDGIDTWRRLHREVAEAQARTRALEQRSQELRAEIEALAADPLVQERAVREELRWARPGEIVVRTPRGDVLIDEPGRAPLP